MTPLTSVSPARGNFLACNGDTPVWWPGIADGGRLVKASRWLLLAVVTVTAAYRNADGQTFTDVTSAAGINHTQFATPPAFYQFSEQRIQTGGAAARDYDGDGFVDLYFTRMDAPDLLYHNNGNGTFSVVDSSVTGLNHGVGSNGAVWGDIDNNGAPDLYVTTVDDSRNYLYMNNGNGTFTEQAVPRGVDVSGKGAAFSPTLGDYDNDGYLDLFTTSWLDVPGNGTRLFHNQGAANPGNFTDVTVAAGVDMSHNTSYQGVTNATFTFSPRFADLNHDGLVDLAVTGDFNTSRMFWNNGDGTFTDGTAAAGLGIDNNGMGSAIGDYNGDGQLDWFVSSIYDQNIPNNAGWKGNGSQLYTNNGDGTFSATAMDTYWGWGSTFFDYDNDGHLDLAVTNGFDAPDEITTIENNFNHNPTLLYHNENGNLVDVGAAEGVTDMDSGKGLLVLDYDNDGKLDMVVVNNQGAPILYHNDSTSMNDWIGFDTVGEVSNADGYGAWITVTENGISQVFEVNAGSNYLGQNDKRAHFGFGTSDGIIDIISIEWPSGITQTFNDVPADAYYTIDELSGLSSFVTVPEPASWLLAGTAALALGVIRLRRKSRHKSAPVRHSLMQGRLVLVVGIVGCSAMTARADVITDWNEVFTQTTRETATTHGVNAGPGPVIRAGAMMFASMYDAINSVDDTHEAYLVNYNVPSTTSREAAASTAAYYVMSSIYGGGATQQARFDSQWASDLSMIPDGPDKTAGINLGISVANNMIAARTNDGSGITATYALNPAAGFWRPAFGQEPIVPLWGSLTPFTMTSGTQFRPGPPGGYSDMASLLASPEYADQVAAVKDLGGLFSTSRTADQTEIAEFWANDNPGTFKPIGQFNEWTQVVAEQQGLSLSDTARLFALTDLALADASIVAWDAKYDTDIDLWRPRDAIQEVVDDGNALTIADPTWQPLALTVDGNPAPAFPSYVSGHATFASTEASVLTAFFGTDDISFSLTSDTSTAIRSFDSFSQAAQECAMSRVYLGVHYPWDGEAAFPQGTALGNYVFDNFLGPVSVNNVPEPGSMVMAAVGLATLGVLALRRRRRHRTS